MVRSKSLECGKFTISAALLTCRYSVPSTVPTCFLGTVSIRNWDPGWENPDPGKIQDGKFRSRIRDKHHGSATLSINITDRNIWLIFFLSAVPFPCTVCALCQELSLLLLELCMVRRLKSDVLKQLPAKQRCVIILDPAAVDSSSRYLPLQCSGTTGSAWFWASRIRIH